MACRQTGDKPLPDQWWLWHQMSLLGFSELTHWSLGDFDKIIFKLILVTDGCDISSEIDLRWTSLDLSDKSTLDQVMAWCHQATSHYLNQCWPRSLLPCGVTRPQWVNSSSSAMELHLVCTKPSVSAVLACGLAFPCSAVAFWIASCS